MNREIFDYQDAIERVGDEELLDELLEDFLEFAQGILGDLKKAIDENNSVMIRNNGHTLKGTAANLSLGNLSQIGLEIENAGKNEDSARYQDLYKELLERVKEFEIFMQEK